MQYCPKCKIIIRGRKRCCPLCQGALLERQDLARQNVSLADYCIDEDLSDEELDATFPVIRKRRVTSHLLFRIATFLAVAAEIVAIALMFLAGESLPWMPILMVGVLIAWADLVVTLYYRNNILKILTVEVILSIGVALWVDALTGWHGWSVEWMIPMTLVGLAVVTIVIGRARGLKTGEYVMYLIFDAVLALLQMIPIHLGLNTRPWAAVMSIAAFLILAAAVVIFRFRELKSATERVFNF